MNLRAPQALPYLRTFHLVATERSFTHAAHTLALSQPAVSAHIRALEHIYGVPLFQIRRRRAYLTAEGEALLAYTERIFNLVGEAEHAVAAVRGLERGRLTFAASPSIGVHLLPAVLRTFSEVYPGIHVHMHIARSEDIVTQVLANRIPFGLVETVLVPDAALRVRPFASDEMIVIVPPDHPWSRLRSVTPAQLQDVLVLRREPDSGLRIRLDRLLKDANVTIRSAMEFGTTEAIIAAVRVGIGIAFVPCSTVARDLELGQLAAVHIEGVDLKRELSIVTLEGAPPGRAAHAFLDLLVNHTAAGSYGDSMADVCA